MERLGANDPNYWGQCRQTGDFAIVELASRQDDLIAAWQLIPLGFGRKSISYRVRVGRLYPIYPGVYAVGTPTLTPRAHLRAALLHHGPTAILSHRSAAAVWGVRASAQTKIDIMIPGPSRRPHKRIELHRITNLHPHDITTHDTIPITSLPRTLLDIATVLTATHLARALEQADRLELLDVRALERVCARYPIHPGKRALQHATEELREPPRTRSELERLFLDTVRDAGLPEPRVNTIVAGYEVDFHWPVHDLVVELDGYGFHRHRAAFERDRVKDTVLQRAGQHVLRVTERRLAHEARAVIEDIVVFLRLPRG